MNVGPVFCFAVRRSARGAQRLDETRPQLPQVLGLEPQLPGLRPVRGTFALDVAQVRLVGRVCVGRELRKVGCKARAETQQLPFGKLAAAAVGRPQQQHLTARVLVRNVVDYLVEELLLVHRQVVEGQLLARLQVIFGIEIQQQFQKRRRKLEVVDQEVVDRRSVDQLQRRTGVAVPPFEVDLLVLRKQVGKALERLVAFVARPLDIPRGLQIAAVTQHPDEIVGPFALEFVRLVGRGVKRGLSHGRGAP